MGLDTFKTHFLFPLILKAFRHFFFAFFENMYRQNTDTMLERKLKKIDLEVGCLENILKKIFPKRPTDFLPDLDSSISSGRVSRS